MPLLFALLLVSCGSLVIGEKCTCGVGKGASRIVGGTEVTDGKYPWMALLVIEQESGKYYGCGGAIINNRYILTASHCFKKAKKVYVVVGTNYRQTNKKKMIESETFILHPEYQREHFRNDIGLVKMKEPFEWSDKIRPICLPHADMDESGELTVAGWGKAENGKASDVLLETKIEEYSFEQCKKSFHHLLDDMHFCASRMGHTSCQGDSGGPVWKQKNGRSYEIGIVSFNAKCGTRESVFTKVTSYIDWIKESTADSEYCED